jgi:hypothetical protein
MVDRWHVLLCSATPYLLREPLISFQIGCCPNWRPVSVISEVSDFGLPSYTCVRVRRRPRHPGAIIQTATRAHCWERKPRHILCRKLRRPSCSPSLRSPTATAALRSLTGVQLLILDDWGLEPLDASARHDLEERDWRRSTILTSQIPVDRSQRIVAAALRQSAAESPGEVQPLDPQSNPAPASYHISSRMQSRDPTYSYFGIFVLKLPWAAAR